jgi:outer membrane receptor for ferrienterochelin and colicins
LDEIKVVSAAGYEQNIADAPASIFVITREELEKKSEQDLTDVLKNVPGVYIEGGSVFKDVSIRGMGSGYTLYLVDGKPVSGNEAHSPNGAGGGVMTNGLPPVSMIERIEIVRGPMSSLYGSEAMGGVINIITRKVPSVWSGTASGEYTKSFNDISEDGYQTNFYLSGPVVNDILSLQTYGSFLGLDESLVQGGSKSASSNPDFKRRQAGAKLILALNDANSVYLGYDYSKQERITTPGKSTDNTSTPGYGLALRDTWSLGHNAKYDNLVLDSYAQYMSTYNNRQRSGIEGITYDVLTLNTQGTYFFESNSLTLGAQYKNEKLEDKVTNSLGGNIPVTMKKWQYAIFAEDEWNVLDDLAITGGVRYNNDEHFGSYVNPRLYAVYNIVNGLVVKGGVSTGYKSPALRQAADDFGAVTGGGRSNNVQVGNPDLNPEKSLNYEIGTSYDNKDIGLSTSATIFYSEFKDKINRFTSCSGGCSYGGQNYDSVLKFENVDKAELYGFEFTLKYDILSSLILTTSYTFQKSEQKTGDSKGEPLNETPKHLASLGLEYLATSKLSAWTQANYRGKAASGSYTDVDYTIADVGINYILSDRIKASAGLYNVFNREITSASAGRYIDGRRVTIGVHSNF